MFILENVEYFYQRDNEISGSTACYPTSMATAMQYCLDLIGKDKGDLGCKRKDQLEDFILKTIKKSGGNRFLGKVQEKAFNDLMNEHGFKAKFNMNSSFDKYVELMTETELPIILHGEFRGIGGVNGHVICGVGYNEKQNEFIVHDPNGTIYDDYKSHKNGEFQPYPLEFFLKDNDKIWTQDITRL